MAICFVKVFIPSPAESYWLYKPHLEQVLCPAIDGQHKTSSMVILEEFFFCLIILYPGVFFLSSRYFVHIMVSDFGFWWNFYVLNLCVCVSFLCFFFSYFFCLFVFILPYFITFLDACLFSNEKEKVMMCTWVDRELRGNHSQNTWHEKRSIFKLEKK